MSARPGFGWFKRAPKKPPPEHGIKLKKIGTTWWGQRWIGALEQVLRGDAGRLARGRTYARAGRTHDLEVKRGVVTAKVTGSRPTPYAITITLPELSSTVWAQAIAGMAERAQFSAELLAGQMPTEIEEVFRAAGASLFPAERKDLATTCSCPDWGDPCKHIAATHYVLGEAFDRDPFLLFELRGRTKELVLAALRSARSGERPRKGNRKTPNDDVDRVADDVPKVRLRKLTVSEYDRPPEPLPTLQFTFDAPVTGAAIVRQLGTPAAWTGHGSPAETLAPIIRAAAEQARRIAMTEVEAPIADGEVARGPTNATEAPPLDPVQAKERRLGAKKKAKRVPEEVKKKEERSLVGARKRAKRGHADSHPSNESRKRERSRS